MIKYLGLGSDGNNVTLENGGIIFFCGVKLVSIRIYSSFKVRGFTNEGKLRSIVINYKINN